MEDRIDLFYKQNKNQLIALYIKEKLRHNTEIYCKIHYNSDEKIDVSYIPDEKKEYYSKDGFFALFVGDFNSYLLHIII